MWILCLILGICFIISLTSFLLLKKDIQTIHRQITYKNECMSHFEIASSTSFQEIKELCKDINGLYEEISKHEEIALKKEREMQTLIAGMSHDMRTPLTSMQGYLDLLQESKQETERNKYIDVIRARLISLKNMLEDLFMHSKLNDDEFTIETSEIQIYPILCKVFASYYYDFEKKQIEPYIAFENEQLMVHANKEFVTRIFQNLIHNVLKYGNTSFSIIQKQNFMRFSNQVNEENLEVDKLFDRLYKGDPSRHHTSSGLGLANVKDMVEAMHWRVEAELKEDNLSIIIYYK